MSSLFLVPSDMCCEITVLTVCDKYLMPPLLQAVKERPSSLNKKSTYEMYSFLIQQSGELNSRRLRLTSGRCGPLMDQSLSLETEQRVQEEPRGWF